jgi:hypothetical protein
MAGKIKKYVIDGCEYEIGVLMMGDIESLLDSIENSQINPEMLTSSTAVIRQFFKTGMIDKFYNIILKGEKQIVAKNIPVEIAVEVVNDFLLSSQTSNISTMIFSVIRAFGEIMKDITEKTPA